MTMTEMNPASRNGVDTATLFATIDAVKQAPAAAHFQFRAHNEWITGTHNRSSISDYFGVGEERAHEQTFLFDADHPAVLVGKDNGPTPVEFLLHALASCLTAGLANIAAARKITLTEVSSTVSGDIDLNGILGLDSNVRNGYQKIMVRFTVKGDASPEALRELVEQARVTLGRVRCDHQWCARRHRRRRGMRAARQPDSSGRARVRLAWPVPVRMHAARPLAVWSLRAL